MKQSGFQFVLLASVLLALCGCKSESNLPPAPRNAESGADQGEIATASEATELDVQAAADSIAKDESSGRDDSDSGPAAETDATHGSEAQLGASDRSPKQQGDSASALANSPPPATADVTTKRLLIFTRRGPLLVDWRISIDGRSMQESLRAYLQRILGIADTDRDGQATWQEIHASPTFQSGRLGNAMFAADADINDLVRRYDLNRNSLLDIDEAPRFLTGLSAGQDLFQLADRTGAQPFGESPLLELLDTNEDGVLSQLECERAAIVLGNQDPDGDEILFPADVSPLASNMMRRRKAADKALLLDQRDTWRTVVYALENCYARNYEFDEDSFLLAPGLLAKLDQNADRSIDKTEAALLAQIDPHLILKTSLGAADGVAREPLILEWLAPVFIDAAPKTLADGSLVIDLHHVTLVLSARDLTGAVDYGQQAAGTLSALDADQNGYLDEAEIDAAPLGASFDFGLADADENEKLFPDEIAAYLREQTPSSANQLFAAVGEVADPVFHAVDKNMDQRLTAREIENAGATIWQFDENQDGLVASDEFPEVIMLRLTRGGSQNSAPLPQPAIRAAPDNPNLPNWFLKMDRNGDLDISRHEFLGNPSQFATLDTNQDGFISADEIEPPRKETIKKDLDSDVLPSRKVGSDKSEHSTAPNSN